MRKDKIKGLLFDKDGTLFDFHTTWSAWAFDVITTLSGHHAYTTCAPARHHFIMQDLAEAMHYDLERKQFRASSPIIAGTNRQAAECVAAGLPGADVEGIERFLMQSSSEAELSPAVPLAAFLAELRARGMLLGVMTNDTEYGARAHLTSAEVEADFDFIAGFDSGYGAKPDPDPLLAFARAMQIAPGEVVMVGDSTHDLIAGRAAGMGTVGVLTGTAGRDELAPYADVIFPDIGHIPAWLDG